MIGIFRARQCTAVGLAMVVLGTVLWLAVDVQLPAGASTPRSQPRATASAQAAAAEAPIRIQIPSLAIDLPIVPGIYNQQNHQWTLTDNNAQFAAMTALPNSQRGLTFIYGHDTTAVFGKLDRIAVGSQLLLMTSAGHTFVYTFKDSFKTQPTDTTILHYDGPPLLMLQTCSGLWSEQRALFRFGLVHMEQT